MHEIEPFYNWRDLYISSEDERSPFFGRQYSEIYLSNTVYNYFIHPQWDSIDSTTLYAKVLYVGYDTEFAVIELMGEWNDTLHNDIMYLYRNLVEEMFLYDIKHFILIGENVLNFHSDTTDYYEEWSDNLGEGWIVGINFREHILREFYDANIDYYIAFSGEFDEFNWRNYRPEALFKKVNSMMIKRLGV